MAKKKRGQGEGCIFQRKDGRWCAVITNGYENGRRLRKVFYGQTRGAVSDQLKEAQGKQVAGVPIPTGRETLGDFLDAWLEQSIKPYCKPKTVASYADQIRLFIKPALGHLLLRRLTGNHVQDFVTQLAKRVSRSTKKNLSPRSVRYTRTILRMALKTAFERKLIPFNPAADGIRMPDVEHKEVEAIEVDQAKALLQAVQGHRLGALFTLLIYTGLRKGECLGLHWADVDLDARRLLVRTNLQKINGEFVMGSPKTGKSRRILTIPPSAAAALREYRSRQLTERMKLGADWTDSGLVFTTEWGTPLDPRNVKRVLDGLLADAKLPHYRIHDLRHACATLLLAQGEDLKTISEILGHSSIVVTANIYAHVSESSKAAAIDRLGEAIGQ